jgi:hypothetical protein
LRFLNHTQRHNTAGRAPGWMINPSQRPLPNKQHATLSTYKRSCSRWDLKLLLWCILYFFVELIICMLAVDFCLC